jgi:hypothetical protein
METQSTSAKFDLKTVGNEKFGQHHLTGNILCVRPNGLFQNPDISKIDDISNSLAEWAVEKKLIKEGDEQGKKLSRTIAGLAVFFAQKNDSDISNLLGVMYLFFPLFVFDDLMDSAQALNSEIGALKKADILGAIRNFKGIFSGTYKNKSEITDIGFPKHMALCESIFGFLDYCAKHVDDYNDKNSIFVEDMVAYFDSVVREHKDNNAIISENAYLYTRSNTVAAKPLIEHLSLIDGIALDEEIRKNYDFNRFRDAVAKTIAMTNDLLSVRKEIEDIKDDNIQNGNIVLVKINNQNMLLPEAFAEANRLLNSEIREVIKYGKDLRDEFPENEGLHKYLLIAENGIDGHLRWYGSEVCLRYGKIELTFSGYISGSKYIKKNTKIRLCN